MRIKLFILFIPLCLIACDINEDVIPPPSLPATVFGQLPTRNAIIQAAEAVGATNVQITRYARATGTLQRGGSFYITVNGTRTRYTTYYYVLVDTNGGYQPSWWQEDPRWDRRATLTSVSIVYDETDNMHSSWTVERTVLQLFGNAGFYEGVEAFGGADIFLVNATTDNGRRLIPLPTHASIIYTVEKLGASNVRVIHYEVLAPSRQDIPSPFLGSYFFHTVPVDSSFYAFQGDIASPTRIIRLSYEHPGLGGVITNEDILGAIRKLFAQYGFESIDVRATGTQLSANFPLPSFNQIRQAAEQAGVNNVAVSTYIASNVDVIPLNEGSRLANMPIVVEVNYDGSAIPSVYTNVSALFANFNNVHIGNNATAIIPLPSRFDIRQAAAWGAWFLTANINEPRVYTADNVAIYTWWELGSIPTEEEVAAWLAGGTRPSRERVTPDVIDWNARIRIVMHGDGTNTATVAEHARQEIIWLFNQRGFSNLDITVNR